jgi:hypothetical protein
MGSWTIDVESEPGVLRTTLAGNITVAEARAWLDAHNRAVDGFRGADYKVWGDLTALAPLTKEAAEVIELAKRYSGGRPNFRGSAVLVSSATVAMQQRRTSTSGGVMDTELISDDVAALREHLRVVDRRGR